MAEVGGRAVRCREYSDHACLSSGHVVAPQSHFTDPEGEPLNLLRDTTGRLPTASVISEQMTLEAWKRRFRHGRRLPTAECRLRKGS